MANTTIAQLTAAAAAAETNLIEMDDGAGGSWKLTLAQVSALTQSSFSGNGPPATQVPYGNAGTYYDYTNKALYNWNPSTSAWE